MYVLVYILPYLLIMIIIIIIIITIIILLIIIIIIIITSAAAHYRPGLAMRPVASRSTFRRQR